jgi:hypothetical protein
LLKLGVLVMEPHDMNESEWSVAAFSFLAAIIGAFAGSILGLNGFAQPVGSTPFNQTPRIKNLGWLLSGFFVMYLADPKRIGLPPEFPLIWPFIGYGVGAVLGVVGSISWMAHSITQSVQSLNSQLPESHQVDAHFFRREYLTYGKARFDERLEKAKIDAVQARDQQKREREIARDQRKRELEIDASRSAAECIYNAINALGVQRKLTDGPLIDALLKTICTKAAAATSKIIVLKGSYMVFVDADEAARRPEQAEREADTLIQKALFTSGMPGRYSGYLELKHGSLRVSQEVVVPIAVVRDAVLPGPPEAVLSQGFSIMNTRDIRFRPEVVPEVQKEINSFYKHPYFDQIASVTSILVFYGRTLHGVMNIESSEPDLFGERRNAVNGVVETLQPFIALLSIFR